ARPLRAWMSGLDGSGSRAAWILFESAWGGLLLCSVIINDVEGILEAAGGEITKKRFEAELGKLRASQKLPWVELPPAYVIGRVADARATHAARATTPPVEFARWEPLFAPPAGLAPAGAEPAPGWDAVRGGEPAHRCRAPGGADPVRPGLGQARARGRRRGRGGPDQRERGVEAAP